MNYKTIVFREFTRESLQRIEIYRREAENTLTFQELELEPLHKDEQFKALYHTKKASVAQAEIPKLCPNKELAAGETLPRLLQTRFPSELIGKPIEEIDPFYRSECVRIFSLIDYF